MKFNVKFDTNLIIGIIGIIIGVIGIIIAISVYYDSSNQISNLENKLNMTQSELNSVQTQLFNAKNEINHLSLENKNEILLALYEVESFGLDNQSKDKFFQTKFGFSYEQAQNMLKYLSETDDYDLAFSNLMYNNYESSLFHFDMALIKDPTNKEVKIGKSISLIGLNRSNEARGILLEVKSVYEDKYFIYKLIGDSYFIEGNYSKSLEYYLKSIEFIYENQQTEKLLGELGIVIDACEIEATGKFDSPWIYVGNLSDGSKYCTVTNNDPDYTITLEYKL